MVGRAINHPFPLLIQGGESLSWVAHTCRRPLPACMRPVGVHPQGAHTSRQKASRRMRHPILIGFRGPKAHGDRLETGPRPQSPAPKRLRRPRVMPEGWFATRPYPGTQLFSSLTCPLVDFLTSLFVFIYIRALFSEFRATGVGAIREPPRSLGSWLESVWGGFACDILSAMRQHL